MRIIEECPTQAWRSESTSLLVSMDVRSSGLLTSQSTRAVRYDVSMGLDISRRLEVDFFLSTAFIKAPV